MLKGLGSWTNYKSKGYYYRPYYYAPSYHHEVHYYNKYPRRYYYYNPYTKKYWGYLDLDHPDKYYLLAKPTADVAEAAKASKDDKTLTVLNEMPVMKDDKGKETGEKLVPPPKDKDLLTPE